MRDALGAAIMALLASGSAVAAAQPCIELPRSEIVIYRLRVDRPDERIIPLSELAPRVTSRSAAAAHPLLDVVYVLDSKVATEHQLVPSGDGGFCDAPVTLRVGFGVSVRSITLAAPAAADDCTHGALLAHEADHYRRMQEGLQEFIARRSPILAQEVLRLESESAPDKKAARLAFTSGLFAMLARMLREFEAEPLEATAAEIDAPDRIAALRGACGGKLEVLETLLRSNPL